MSEPVFVRILGEVVGVNVRALSEYPALAVYDCGPTKDGYVKRYEVPDNDTWESLKAVADAYVDKPPPIIQIAAPAIALGMVGFISKHATELANTPAAGLAAAALKKTPKIALISAAGALVKETTVCIVEENVSPSCLLNAGVTAAYAYLSTVVSVTVGSSAGTLTTAGASLVVSPAIAGPLGIAAGAVAGLGAQSGLDWLKRQVAFGLSKEIDRWL